MKRIKFADRNALCSKHIATQTAPDSEIYTALVSRVNRYINDANTDRSQQRDNAIIALEDLLYAAVDCDHTRSTIDQNEWAANFLVRLMNENKRVNLSSIEKMMQEVKEEHIF